MPIAITTNPTMAMSGQTIALGGTGLDGVKVIGFSTIDTRIDQEPVSQSATQITVEVPASLVGVVQVTAIGEAEVSNTVAMILNDTVPFEQVVPLCDLQGVKASLGITGEENHDDVRLQELIRIASAQMTRKMRRVFGVRSFQERHRGQGSRLLLLKNTPVAAVQSLMIDGQQIDIKEVDVREECIEFIDGGEWNPRLRATSQVFGAGATIDVLYTAGYSAVPADIVAACIHQVVFLRNLGTKQGILSESNQTAGATDSYSQDQLCADAARVCNRYRRHVQAVI
jgi:hypothetical protein